MEVNQETKRKYDRLKTVLGRLPSLAVAFSGGVDSSLLLAAAIGEHGDRVLALTAVSPVHPDREIRAAVEIAGRLGVHHLLVRTGEMDHPGFRANPPERCYICKRRMLEILRDEASRLGFARLAHGANRDDLADYRPGMRAASEMAIAAPLVEADLTKSDVRLLARHIGLPNWDRPAMACLASRIPYGTPITRKLLERVEAAENLLAEHGFRGGRVRCHGEVARIELASPGDMARVLSDSCRASLAEGMKSAGFTYVALDLEGYRQGSLNAYASGRLAAGGLSGGMERPEQGDEQDPCDEDDEIQRQPEL